MSISYFDLYLSGQTWIHSASQHLVAPYRAILRYYRCDTPYRTILLREVSTPPKWCDTPPWYLILHRHICAIPHFATYRAIIVRDPIKKKQARKSFAMLSLQVSRDMTSIAAGPLSPNMIAYIYFLRELGSYVFFFS